MNINDNISDCTSLLTLNIITSRGESEKGLSVYKKIRLFLLSPLDIQYKIV